MHILQVCSSSKVNRFIGHLGVREIIRNWTGIYTIILHRKKIVNDFHAWLF